MDSSAETLVAMLESVGNKGNTGLLAEYRLYLALAKIALEELDRRGMCLHFAELQPAPKVPDFGRIMRGEMEYGR